MYEEMKVLFLKSQNINSAATIAIAKILLPDQGKNNENTKFLKESGLEYMA